MSMVIARAITNVLLLFSLVFNGLLIYFMYHASRNQKSLLSKLLVELAKLKDVLTKVYERKSEELNELMSLNLKTQTLLESLIEKAENKK